MYKGKKVSVVMPAYNEEESIAQVIKDFQRDFVDEIIVVDNNSIDTTIAIAKNAGAKVVEEKKQGQGYAMARALKEAKGDLVFITESDCTFFGKDMMKLLQYIEDVDVVIGSRIHKPLIGPKAMNWYTRWGNCFLSCMLQILWGNKASLDDVGVTFKLFKREVLNKILKEMRIGGADACPEHIFLSLKHGFKIVQVPTWYASRRGLTKQSFNIFSSIKIGALHLFHIVYRRFF